MSQTLVVLLFAGLFAAALAHFLRRGASRIARIAAAVLFGLGLLLALIPSLSLG
ncbi:hypothetical protein SAMN05421678_114191 [Actinopolymorpha cephalotaxi]|uniref:Protein-S-isoprenylcysteine O-methyltransferase Ste14 n=1 Tax=Actinopolymorpha cephalotaxi TaxID=504797 RepID=A0A1I2YN09_9ACTN|nr:hypothetical protein [Actinopolymorpha cephalotaxi]NYH86875.1 protein-S-isoprenylcysteine O-methyltransferase Ste14 [Actinopolymorpha cephalotaxi]SFH26958.1 hypothetical protein SAMN05421678_114191 [Actinopolymorpha cephalotaxi]